MQNLPKEIPAGIRTNIEAIAKAVTTDRFAVAKTEVNGQAVYLLCSVEKSKGEPPVIRTLCEIIDASQEHEAADIDMTLKKPAAPKSGAH